MCTRQEVINDLKRGVGSGNYILYKSLRQNKEDW